MKSLAQPEHVAAMGAGESPRNETTAAVDFDAVQQQIRGSTLLFLGRPVSLGVNLVTQVLIVRYLVKADYGAFAFAFALSETASVIAMFGMEKAISRYAAIYDEGRDEERLSAVIALAIGLVIALGIFLVAGVFAVVWMLPLWGVSIPLPATLLLILIFLAPTSALDNVFVSLASVLSGARLVLLRRVLLAPGLRLLAVALAIGRGGSVTTLAYTYVALAVLGVAIYGLLIWSVLRRRHMLTRIRWQSVTDIFGEVVGYSASLFGSELTLLLRATLVVIFLELLSATSSVAEYRAVLPIARLAEVVLLSFAMLYIPFASRSVAKQQTGELNQLYWRTATWVAVLTFPLFAISYALADPLTVLMFGAEYAEAGKVLAVLALGFYFNAALGFNSRTLKVVGMPRQALVADVLALILAIALYVAWIPSFGALGAATAASVSTVVHALAKQISLHYWTEIRWCSWQFTQAYLAIAAATCVLTAWLICGDASPWIGSALVLTCSVFVAASSRRALEIGRNFPELVSLRLRRRTTVSDTPC